MKIVIIGAGIAGIYTAYILITVYKINKNNIIILDKNNYIGGRCLEKSFHDTKILLGSGIFEINNTHLIKLLDNLNIKYSSFTSNMITKLDVSDRIKTFNNYKQQIIKTYTENKSFIDSNNLTFRQFILYYFDNNFLNTFLEITEYSDYLESSVYFAIYIYDIDNMFISPNQTLYYINNGWSELFNKLLNFINKDNIILESSVNYISKNDNYFSLKYSKNNQIIDINNISLLFVCADLSIKNITFNNIDVSFLNNIGSCPFFRCFAYSKDEIPPEKNKKRKLNSFHDKQIPMNNNVIMYIYSDNDKAYTCNNIFINNPSTNTLNNILKENYDDYIWKYWDHGVHFYKNNNLYNYNRQTDKIFFLGEFTSHKWQGYMEGAILSVDNFFNIS